MVTDDDRERVRLVELDYGQTNDFIKSVIATGATMRGLGISIWLALVGVAIQQNLWELSILAFVVSGMFFVLDGYHGWLYSEALKHARAAEKVTAAYYDAISRGDDDEEVMLDFREELRSHRLGLFLSLHHVRPADLLQARPTLLYRTLYPTIGTISLVVAVLVGTGTIGK